CNFFFFQAEDGIRDFHVTGVQTCALPIYDLLPQQQVTPIPEQAVPENKNQDTVVIVEAPRPEVATPEATTTEPGLEASEAPVARSEERRVGKESRTLKYTYYEK